MPPGKLGAKVKAAAWLWRKIASQGMNKSQLSLTQRVVNSIRKAVRMLEDRPAPTPKVKLDGRRGYGDGDIPSPDRDPDDK
jgi:hypothetical protein